MAATLTIPHDVWNLAISPLRKQIHYLYPFDSRWVSDWFDEKIMEEMMLYQF